MRFDKAAFASLIWCCLHPSSAFQTISTASIRMNSSNLSAMGKHGGVSPKYSAGGPKVKSIQKDKDAKVSDSADSNNRRQLLFSLLTTSIASATMRAPVYADSTTPIATAKIEEESIANAFKTYVGGKLITPPMDPRLYDVFTLPNGLKVILCSDPSSNTAAAAMDVHVGAASDPGLVPGLAHFCEHMLFLGTKKYPDEDSFETFLSANGGSSNAFTADENTVYYFDMTAEDDKKLSEGLDRFGSFFTGPLFTESSTNRELNAIESENAKNLQSDVFRLYQIEKSRANNLHPYSKFYTGNKKTLLDDTKKNKVDLRSELIKFYGKYYSADVMSLGVVGPQPLPLLKEMVLAAFSDVPTNDSRLGVKPEQSWAGKIPPFLPGNNSIIPAQKNIVEIVPVADIRQVILTWPIVFESVKDKEAQFLDKPAFYISHLLGHEGPNSLLSYLKKQGWANGLGSSTDAELSDFYTFQVSVQLTEKGLKNIDDIVEAIYSYIQMLRDDPMPRYVIEEVVQLSELEWRFLTTSAPGSYAQSISQNLQKYPEALTVAGPRRLALREKDNMLIDSNKPRSGFTSDEQYEITVESIGKLLSKLNVDNCLLAVVSKTLSGKAKKNEKWYGTKYNVSPVSMAALNKWSNCKKAATLGIGYPRPNIFIPDEKGLVVKKPVKDIDKVNKPVPFEERLKPIPPPTVIRDDGEGGKWTVYFKQDEKFGQPKAYAIFQLLTKDVYATPEKAALASMYQVSANDKLVEYAYDASLSGLTYDVQVLPRGVRLTFGGYNDKLVNFATYISRKLSRDVRDLLPNSIDEFERYRDEIRRALAGFDVQQPYSHAIYYTNLLLQPKSFQYTNSEMRIALENLSLPDLEKYVETIWDSGKVEALIQGNMDEREALDFVDAVDKTISFESMPATEIPPRLKPLPVPETVSNEAPICISTAEPNPSNPNAAIQVTYQCLDTSEKSHVIIEVIASVISEKFYEDLRTKQQLGYIVSCGVKAASTARLLSFVVQSSVAPTSRLKGEIMKFVGEVKEKFLEPLTDDQVSKFARALVLKKTDPDKKLATEATRNWNEISSGRLEFDRRQNEAKVLLTVTKDDVIRYWDEFVLGKSGKHRVLVSEVIPKNGAASSKSPAKTYIEMSKLGIDDVQIYRTNREKEIE